jgi:sec-independent protein translocase protein TatB
MSFSHMIILALIALIVIPPDKLPDFARQLARILRDLRRSTAGVWDDLKHDAMLKPEDLMKHKVDLNEPNIAPPSSDLTTQTSQESYQLPLEPLADTEKKPNE